MENQHTLAGATIVAKRDLSQARVLARSFAAFHPEVTFFVLLVDEVDGYFEPRHEPFRLLQLSDLSVPHLPRFRFHYSQQELTYACTPYLLSHLLDQGYERAAFFKQESMVVGDLTPVFDLLNGHSIVLTPHLLEPLRGDDRVARELNILQSGIYNVGFLGVSEAPAARAFLAWWQDRLYEHCRHDVPGGMHFEQRWLDLVPVFFEGVAMVRDPGFNVGHWNLPDRQVRHAGDAITVDNRPARFIRFSGFEADKPHAVTRYNARLNLDNLGSAAELFRRYAALLEAAGYHTTKHWPYAYDRFDNGVAITPQARQLFREFCREHPARAALCVDPLHTETKESFYAWLQQRLAVDLPQSEAESFVAGSRQHSTHRRGLRASCARGLRTLYRKLNARSDGRLGTLAPVAALRRLIRRPLD